MEKYVFIVRMYVSKLLVAVLLAYAYLSNSSPSTEGILEKSSPAFFAQELENSDEVEDIMPDHQDLVESNQE